MVGGIKDDQPITCLVDSHFSNITDISVLKIVSCGPFLEEGFKQNDQKHGESFHFLIELF